MACDGGPYIVNNASATANTSTTGFTVARTYCSGCRVEVAYARVNPTPAHAYLPPYKRHHAELLKVEVLHVWQLDTADVDDTQAQDGPPKARVDLHKGAKASVKPR